MAANLAGNQLWVSFLLGAFISSFTGLSYAELSTTIPKAAAEYSYVQESFKTPLGSFLVGWMIIFTESVAAATVALAFGGYFHGVVGNPITVVAVVLILVLSLLNYVGIELSNKINIVFSLIEIGGLILIIFIGIPYLGSVNYMESPYGIRGVLQGSALIFFAYIGFEDIANLAEESKNPEKDMPRALLLSILITAFLYLFVALAAVSVVDWSKLGISAAPLALIASKSLGTSAFGSLSVIALFATANTVLILLIVCSRTIYGMARDGRFPSPFSSLSKMGTPTFAIILTALLSLLFTLPQNLKLIAEITNFGTFVTFCSVNLSAIRLRYTRPDLKRPFKTPFTIGKMPIIPLIGLLSSGMLITQLSVQAVIIGLCFLLIGVIFFWFCKSSLGKRLHCGI